MTNIKYIASSNTFQFCLNNFREQPVLQKNQKYGCIVKCSNLSVAEFLVGGETSGHIIKLWFWQHNFKKILLSRIQI
jgi:hypothetical protein